MSYTEHITAVRTAIYFRRLWARKALGASASMSIGDVHGPAVWGN